MLVAFSAMPRGNGSRKGVLCVDGHSNVWARTNSRRVTDSSVRLTVANAFIGPSVYGPSRRPLKLLNRQDDFKYGKWWALWGSNPGPTDYKPCPPTTDLRVAAAEVVS
jgi:hypothetical protein